MKTIKILLIIFTVSGFGMVNAQTKKKHKAKNVTKMQPKSATKPIPSKRLLLSAAEVHSDPKVAEKESVQAEKTYKAEESLRLDKVQNVSNPFKTAIGIKFFWGISLTGKHFLKENQAIEVLVRYRGFKDFGNEFSFSALYEYEKQIPGLENLHWVAGGGARYQLYNYKNEYEAGFYEVGIRPSTFGLAAIVGLEYKIKELPLAISVDWMP